MRRGVIYRDSLRGVITRRRHMSHCPFGRDVGGVGEHQYPLGGSGHMTRAEIHVGGGGGDEGGSHFGMNGHV